jgi:hypothetical protein
VWIACALSACSGATTLPPPTQLYGEVHVHQFPGGTHPAALFLAQAVATASVDGDTVVPSVTLPTVTMGACVLTLPSSCAPPCGPVPDYIDGGAVHLRGERGGAIDLMFAAETGGYDAATQTERVFADGERITVRGDGAVAPPFSGEIVAPATLVAELPSPLAVKSGLAISWVPDRSDYLSLALAASTSDGSWGVVACRAADGDGQITVPPSLLAQLPPPPRQLSLSLSRDRLGYADGPAGEGILLHAGFALSAMGHEDP